MCELLIYTRDKGDDNHWVKRGTVVETLEDGHVYGAEELTGPQFRIIMLPGVPVAWGRAFMGKVIRNAGTAREAAHRMFLVDLDHASIHATMRRYLDDDARMEPAFLVDEGRIPRSSIAALKTARTYQDPTILGDPANVIGP